MEENNNFELSDKIKSHLDSVTKSSGLPYNEESINLITQNWVEKKKMFEDQIKLVDMIEVESFDKNDPRSVILLTYSGSLISIGSILDNFRHVEYSSIKLRKDVPDIVIINETNLSENIAVDDGVSFTAGPIKKTSNILKIAVCKEDVEPEEQDNRIREATIFLTNGFVMLNRYIVKDENLPGQFTMKAIIKYIAAKNDLTQKLVKQILEDYLYMLESGMLLGEKAPLGRIGKLSLKLRAAQKARVGINPATGEEMTIKAKPEMLVPKMSFGKAIKEKAANIRIDKIEIESEIDEEFEE